MRIPLVHAKPVDTFFKGVQSKIFCCLFSNLILNVVPGSMCLCIISSVFSQLSENKHVFENVLQTFLFVVIVLL